VEQLIGKKELKSQDGLYFKSDLERNNFKKALIPDLNQLPIFDIDFLNRENYYSTVGSQTRIITLLTSRGCPYSCTFCDVPDKNYRTRNIDNIIQEIKLRLEQGYKEIFFYDDTFNLDSNRVINLCNRINSDNLKFRWSFRGRVNTVTFEMLKAAKLAGCRMIHFGIETATDEGLEFLKKGIEVAQIKKVFLWCKKLGIKTIADFIIGLPFEKTKKDVKDNVERLIKFGPDYAQFNVLQPVPGSEIYKNGVELGIINKDSWNLFVSAPYPDFKPPLWNQYLSTNDLEELFYYAYRKFYIRPSCIISAIIKVSTIHELKRIVQGGLRIFFKK
jgi:radical SAM superfamily enzyme YgiQ (UPF0313 family)